MSRGRGGRINVRPEVSENDHRRPHLVGAPLGPRGKQRCLGAERDEVIRRGVNKTLANLGALAGIDVPFEESDVVRSYASQSKERKAERSRAGKYNKRSRARAARRAKRMSESNNEFVLRVADSIERGKPVMVPDIIKAERLWGVGAVERMRDFIARGRAELEALCADAGISVEDAIADVGDDVDVDAAPVSDALNDTLNDSDKEALARLNPKMARGGLTDLEGRLRRQILERRSTR